LESLGEAIRWTDLLDRSTYSGMDSHLRIVHQLVDRR
jgi:hypothetical protein